MPNKTVIPLNQSQLYKLTSPRRLADVLGLAEAELRAMATGPDRYRQFEIEKKSGGKRPVEDPVAPLKRVQGRIAKMLARIEPPSFLFCPVKGRSEEHTSELQSLMRISYAVFCLKKKNNY